MTHIGQHVNVLALLGVMTKRIEFRQLFLVLELCRLGSLKKYLQEFDLVDEDVRLTSGILAQKQIKIENTKVSIKQIISLKLINFYIFNIYLDDSSVV